MYFTRLVHRIVLGWFVAHVIFAGAREAAADILYVANNAGGSIGEYNTDGTVINAQLITGLHGPDNIAISGTDLYETNYGGASVGKYTTAGGTINASLITGITTPTGIAVNGSQLFVALDVANEIGEYTTSGGTVNSSLIFTGSSNKSLALSGGNLFVSGYMTTGPHGSVQEYATDGTPVNVNLLPAGVQANYLTVYNGHIYVSNYFAGTITDITIAGDVVNSSFITGLNFPTGLVVSNGHLFIATQENDIGGPGRIGEYSLSGTAINASLITGLPGPAGLAIVPTPEPASVVLLATAGVFLCGVARLAKRRRR